MVGIDQHGPAAELAQLTQAPGGETGRSQYDLMLDQVQLGGNDWLAVAAKLYPATDAGTRDSLLITVSEAIQNNPAGVMRLVDTIFRIDDICKDGLIEPTPAQKATFLEKTRAALRSVHSGPLRARRDACLKLLS